MRSYSVAKEPLEQIRKGDSWYVSDQMAEFEGRSHIRRTIDNRLRFIFETIEEWENKTAQSSQSVLRLLDAGCGDGVLLKVLTNLKGFEVYGVDYSPLRVGRAQANVPEAIVSQGDLRNLHFEDDFFDVVILSQVLEHIPEDVPVLKSLARVLKRDGILILGVPNEGCFIAQLRNKYFESIISRTTDHVNFYTEKTIGEKIAQAGLSIEKLMRENFFFPHSIIQTFLTSHEWGFRIAMILNKLIKSQVAGLYFVCKKGV